MTSPKLASQSIVLTAILASTLALLAQACSSGGATQPGDPDPDPDPTPPATSFALALSSDKLPVLTGSSATIEVTLTRTSGFDGAVTLTPAGLPPLATASFAPETLAAGQTKSTLTVTAPAGTPHSLPTAVTIRGAAGNKQVTKPLTVTITGAPGSLDTSFGATGGKVLIPAGASDDYALAMAVQPDGKIVAVGRAAENRTDFAVMRLERDGALDATFGPSTSPGKVLTDFGASSDIAYAVAVQPDGKIVVAGNTIVAGSGLDFAVARYNADGSLDTTFGSGGKLTTAFSADSDTAYALLLQPDGKIVVGGDSNQGSSGTGIDYALARYNTDGTLDATFGQSSTPGKVTTALAAFSGRDSIYSLTLQTVAGEARIVAAGGEGDFSVARYLPNGTLDATFGAAGTGKVTALMGSSIGAARAVRVAADDKIVLAGHVSGEFALVRLDAGGRVDGAFGSSGKVITPVPSSRDAEAQGLAIDGDGKIIVAGWATEANSSAGNFAVLRYLTDGQLDTTFGGTGMVITPMAEGTRADQGNAILLQTDDRIPAVRVLVAGQANAGSNYDFAVARYWR
ncbi:MAG TPA: hypothetical protein VIQ54_05405 [Polyangia bacterium]